MRSGPSPVVPFLMVGALGLFVCRGSLTSGYEFVAEVQDMISTVPLLVVVLIGLLLVVGTMTELVIIPLAFLLVVFLLRAVLVASLLLVLAVHFLARLCHSCRRAPMPSCRDDEDGTALCWFILLPLCFILCLWFCEVDVYGWISLVFGITSIIYFNML